MVKEKFRHPLLCLAVLLMLPQWSGVAAAAEPTSAKPDSTSAQEGKNVSDFYNVIMQTGADPWVYKHTDGYYYNVFANSNDSNYFTHMFNKIAGVSPKEYRKQMADQ
jgi:methylphosphotriester-DNA--protein-cysteine methyltransferase